MALVTPLYMFRIVAIGLIVFPLDGHCGFGSWKDESSVNHYIHHTKFNWNYGSLMWDHFMGTNYPQNRDKINKERDKEALEQAALVKCDI